MPKPLNTPWWVYMVETRKGFLYTGVTTDLERRLRQHRGELKGGAKYFRSDPAVAIRYRRRFKDRSLAQQCEAKLKRLTRAQKLALVAKAKTRA